MTTSTTSLNSSSAVLTPQGMRSGRRAGGRRGQGEKLFVLACSLLAITLRLAWLDHESLWYDEAYTMRMVAAGYLLTKPDADPGNPPGYFLLARCWTDLLGAQTGENVRALSALAGALTIPIVWLLARALRLPRGARRLGCFLVAVSPPLVYLGQEARVFALFMTVATLALTFVVWIQRSNRWSAWLGFALTGVALVYLHYYGFFVLIVLGLDVLIWAWRERNAAAVGRLFLCAFVVGLAFLPWLPTFLWQLSLGVTRSRNTWWQHLGLLPSFAIIGRTLVWKDAGQFRVALVAALILATIYLPLLWVLIRSRVGLRPLVSFVLGLPALVGLLALKLPMVHTHYLSVVLPALTLLLALGLHTAYVQHARLGLVVPTLALAVFMPASLARLYFVQHKEDWRGLVAQLEQEDRHLPVFFYEDIGEEAFSYYAQDRNRLVRLDKLFGKDGASWRQADYFQKFHSQPEGFWLVLYLVSAQTSGEEAAIRSALGKEFAVEEKETPSPMKLLRCRPRISLSAPGKG